MAVVFLVGKRGKSGQDVGISCPSGLGLSLGGKKPNETEVTLRREEDSSTKGKGKATSVLPEVQSSSSAKKEVKFGSKKLWTTLFPPSSDRQQGLRCRSRVGSDLRGSAITVLPSTPEIRGKELSFMGNYGLLVAENLEVISFSPTQSPPSSPSPSCDDVGTVGQISVAIHNLVVEEIQPAYPYQLTESINPIFLNHFAYKVSNLVTVSKGVYCELPIGYIPGGKQMFHRGLGSRKKRRVVKDFLRSEKPDVVMMQEQKRQSVIEGGNFNIIRRSSEKLGGSSLTPSMKDFDDFIRECELIDSPLWSTPFTWSNMQESLVCKRLDRFLYSNEWEQLFPQSLQEVLPRWTSDHWPIVLETNPFKWGPTPFRFENLWLQHPSFKESFRSWWRDFQGIGWEGHKFMRKLPIF
ncbi:hypothetical protein CK203_082622 [Vitis vinifera]|uniref:Endonuclease/exonuclease/phosphatase domain-containing protein n=1 Tax=Vitis vinifera TaxID=29760 RepID=A0A438BXP7_VITVI|nr:hypothetical protein CK203_082622 [Vitis vinifera]